MSFFVKAAVAALKLWPGVNAEVRDDNIVYKNYYDVGVAVQTDRGLIVLKDVETGHLIPVAVKHRHDEQTDQIRISRTIVNQVMLSKEAILSADAASDTRFDSSQSIADMRIHSMMCAPLMDTDGSLSGWRLLMMMLEHEIHHRSQIDTYAGLQGWPVPDIYGRSAEQVGLQRPRQRELHLD
ncbi:hypothetical protein LCGC14_2114660, partial [marine sediment metagenome]